MLEFTGRLTAPTRAVEIADGGFRISTQMRVFPHSGSQLQHSSQSREEDLKLLSEIPYVLMNKSKTF